MNALKTNKFRVGDYVEIINHKNTVDRFGGNAIGFPQIGLVGVVNKVTDHCVGIVDHMYLMDASDVELLETNKFRVGDKVQVIKDNCTKEWFTVEDQYIDGVVVQVNPEEEEDRYYVKIKGFKGVYDDGCFAFNDEHLKLIEACETVSEQDKTESKPYNPLIAQEGGGHYKDRGIQPLEYTMQNNLSFCEGNVVKYISRYKSKNGIEDLAKVIHYALLASYEEYGEQGSTELKEKVLKLLGEHG